MSSSTQKTKSAWEIPIVFIAGAILWIFVTMVKWHLVQKRHKKHEMENKKLEQLLKFSNISEKTAAEVVHTVDIHF